MSRCRQREGDPDDDVVVCFVAVVVDFAVVAIDVRSVRQDKTLPRWSREFCRREGEWSHVGI